MEGLPHLPWSSSWAFLEQMHWLSDQLSSFDFFVTQPQPAGKDRSFCLFTLFIYLFVLKVSASERLCECVLSVLTLNSSLRVTNAPKCFPFLPQTKATRTKQFTSSPFSHSPVEEEGRRRSECQKWGAVKRSTFYFAAGLTSLNSLKTRDKPSRLHSLVFGFYNTVYVFWRRALAVTDSSPDLDPSLAPHHAAPQVRKWGRHIIQPRVDTIIEGNGLCRTDCANHVNMFFEARACSIHHSATSQL